MADSELNKKSDIYTIALAQEWERDAIPTIPVSEAFKKRQEDSLVKKISMGVLLGAFASAFAGELLMQNHNPELGCIIAIGGDFLSVAGGIGSVGLWMAKDNGVFDFPEKPYFPTEEEARLAWKQLRAAEIGPENVVSTTIFTLIKTFGQTNP
jgi:hypothetical protein